MKKLAKITALLVAILMVTSMVLSGCTKTAGNTESTPSADNSAAGTTAAPSENALDTSEAVELSMYLLGDPAKEYNLALDELNKKAKQDINATVSINWIGWGDMATKYPLVLASGEPIDLIFTATWAFFKEQAQKGAFKALDEIGPKYAPVSFQEEPKDALEQAKVDGKIYCLPMNYPEYNTWGYMVRGDLLKKSGVSDIKNMDDFGKYLEYVAQNEKGITPIHFGNGVDDNFDRSFDSEQRWWSVAGLSAALPLVVKLDDETCKVFNKVATPEYAAYFKKMREWQQKGFWSKSVLSNKVTSTDSFTNGSSASAMWNLIKFNETYIKINGQNPAWDPQYFEAQAYSYINEYTANAMAIPNSAQNPERALMFLEKLRTDESYFDLTTYGIKGKHFEITADGKLKALNPENYGPDSSCPWGWRIEKFYKDYEGSYPKLAEVKEGLKSRTVKPRLQAFTLLTDSIKSEMAAISNVMQQYENPLKFGLVDPDKYTSVLIQKLNDAGIEKVQAEVQKQIDEYLKNK